MPSIMRNKRLYSGTAALASQLATTDTKGKIVNAGGQTTAQKLFDYIIDKIDELLTNKETVDSQIQSLSTSISDLSGDVDSINNNLATILSKNLMEKVTVADISYNLNNLGAWKWVEIDNNATIENAANPSSAQKGGTYLCFGSGAFLVQLYFGYNANLASQKGVWFRTYYNYQTLWSSWYKLEPVS